MATFRITSLDALEILDSRSRPTLQVTVALDDVTQGVAGVPSGASTGSREALERRDGDKARYGGHGVAEVVAAVRGEIRAALVGPGWSALAEIDDALIALDGTATKSRLGANAVIGTSLACARALAQRAGQPLWQWLAIPGVSPRLPVPHFNVLNGGAHASNRLDFQEFMLAPIGAPNFAEAVRAGAETYAVLRGLLKDRGFPTGLGDEGGFAPDLTETQVLDILVEAITRAGYAPGRSGVAIALDPAASGFYHDGAYQVAGQSLTTAAMVGWYAEAVTRYPIWSIEDGLAEDDWEGWAALTERIGTKVQLVGDDIFVTDPATIRLAADRRVANAALIKPNQIGTVTETLLAIETARLAGYAQMVSHRSGETTDTFIADLAVGSGCGQIKAGAPARGERVAKYNRLLEITAAEPSLPYGLAELPADR